MAYESYFVNETIKERTINDAWRMLILYANAYGRNYRIKRGSYEGQIRKQLDIVKIHIEQPWVRPLSVSMPENSGIPAPTSEERIHQYFYEYLMSPMKEGSKEDYTYGDFITKQIEKVIDILNNSKGGTNQAIITVGNEKCIDLKDPPCLREISFNVLPTRPKQLQMFFYFRSWDIFAGFPENVGGLQLLKEFVLMNLKFKVVDGPIRAVSTGAHLYEQYFPIIQCLAPDLKKLK